MDTRENNIDELLEDVNNELSKNRRLEELIKNMDMGYVGPSNEKQEFLELFRGCQLFMPVIMSSDFTENLKDSKPGDIFETTENSGFNINYISYDGDKKGVALFTSDEMMKESGLRSSVIGIYMSDLAEMLKQTDRYSMVFINPYTDLYIDMPIDSFLNLFNVPESEFIEALKSILKLLKEKSIELEGNYIFYLRSDENFMMENAVEGVFVPNIPLNVSSREDFKQDLKYLNLIAMPKDFKILFLGDIAGEDNFDTIIAPECEFKLVKEIDETTALWECQSQPFYEG